ncbi:guanine nucleotide-binding protein-like 1 [Chelonus insularis]|uniref:guanine nucleotide-binding protein-like 1 n=1 Tax=Chelonus insularis TaxID=460826 RepID=UPI00158B225F|nr:guanine nucleotide-binding protein-like 1 [Chelonus insularis]
MPQGRRKMPFSGKAKKQQMQNKKLKQQAAASRGDNDDSTYSNKLRIRKLNKQPTDKAGVNRYNLHFLTETREELEQRKWQARQIIKPVPLIEQEISDNFFPPGLDMPKRPPWDFSMSKNELEAREHAYFEDYMKKIQSLGNVGYCELNLETWRQLWRVIEMSDVLLTIIDIRYPPLMFPPYLYDYITRETGKKMILVFNKIDLAPPSLVIAWREYFKTQYPQLHILFFTSFPDYNLRKKNKNESELKEFRRKGKLKMAAEGAQKLLEVCEEIVKDKVDLSEWRKKIQEEINSEYDLDDLDRVKNVTVENKDTGFFKHEKFKNGILTIGCIGYPNVGKSSFMNAIIGNKVVSVSRTPGHTKHFQTIFLTKTVCVCDCPGLVFPSTVPKQLQILMGSFPVAQVREPYTAVLYIAERIDLPRILRIQHPEDDDTWSAIDICDGWAVKRNYKTSRTGRLDTYRAANSLLRMAVEGRICLCIYPVGWSSNKEKWEKHPDIGLITWIQARSKELNDLHGEDHLYSDDETGTKDTPEDSEGEEGSNAEDSDDESDNDELMSVSNKFNVLAAD